jgi:hypothetical protein
MATSDFKMNYEQLIRIQTIVKNAKSVLDNAARNLGIDNLDALGFSNDSSEISNLHNAVSEFETNWEKNRKALSAVMGKFDDDITKMVESAKTVDTELGSAVKENGK